MLKKILLLTVLLLPLSSFAASSVHFGDYFLKGAEKAQDDVYAIGRTSAFVGSVTGDAVSLARTVRSQSAISGDALFIGEEVLVGGEIADDARIVGGVVTLNGTIKDDVLVIGSKVIVGETARIEGSLYMIGGEAEIRGAVLGDAKALVRTLVQTGTVMGDMEVWGDATFREPASIGGDFIYHTGGKAAAPVNVAITGKVILDEAKGEGVSVSRTLLGGFFSVRTLMMLALGFLLFFLARERTEELLIETLPNFGIRALRGFLVMLVLPLVVALLLPSIIGIPIALLFGALFLILLLLSWVSAGIMLGAWCERIFFKRSAVPLTYRPVLLGVLFISILSLIPLVGPLFHGILMIAAAGSLSTLFFRSLRRT